MAIRLLSRIKNLIVPPGSRPHTIRGGAMAGLRMHLDLTYRTQWYLGLFEREAQPWLRRLGEGIGSFVDIGAAQGEYTLYALARTPARRVLAFEPDAEARRELADNLALNGLEGDARLVLSEQFVGAAPDGRTRTLDSLAAELPAPCFVKIDVDGGEGEVLRGAEALLRRPDSRWLIETHSADLEAECLDRLRAAGCNTVVIPNAWWRVIVPEDRPIAHNRWLAAFHGDPPGG